MPAEITMPQLSDTMSEGTLIKWLAKEGDEVNEGDVIAEVETDKANMEMEAFEGGTVVVLAVKEGDKVKVGERIAVLATAGEDVEQVRKQFAAGAKPKKAEAASDAEQTKKAGTGRGSQTEAEQAGSIEGASSHETEMGRGPLEEGRRKARRSMSADDREEEPKDLTRQAATFKAKERAREDETAATTATATREAPSRAPARTGNGRGGRGRLRISPLAQRMAEDLGVDVEHVDGSGPNGRIVQQDILAFSRQERPAGKAPAARAPARADAGRSETIELNRMRQTIATRMQQSKQQVPHFYETIDVDMEALVALRTTLNKQLEKQDIKLSISDFVNKAVAAALVRHPAVNAHFDAKNNRIVRYSDVHLGIAVAVPDGLIVPVLRSIDQMGLKGIREKSVDLAERARGGRLKRDELSGATFTVSTLGNWGIRDFSAIINPPEVGILAIGAAEKRPVVRGDQIVARTMMSLTLSVDHRGVDGATAADFLRTLKNVLEEPGMMLV
jgi:pyruvate dehydrogenase E2 component (dihydrolipoamide acetyltransferase)